VKITKGNPPQVNHSGLFNLLRTAFLESLGKERVIEYPTPSLGGEDFAFYSQKVPGCFILLGCGNNKGKGNNPLHSSHFDFDESILPVGAAAMACSAIALIDSKDWF